MPLFQAASTAWHSGSVVQLSPTGCPSERFITRMLYLLRLLTTHWMPAITPLTVPEPLLSSTLTFTRPAWRAMP